MSATVIMCGCGRPLHYRDDKVREQVQRLVDQLGPEVIVTAAGKSWRVPRHYIALHGLKSWEVKSLGFPAVP